jgi:NADH:ubiquinone oxidoreductase subunit 6 (subunit J)
MSLGFIALVLVTITAAIVVVTTRYIIHAAVFLGGSFIGVAGLYLLLDAPFIAGAQVLIYVGAITVLILFALMLTSQSVMREARRDVAWKWLSAVVSFVLFAAVLLPTIRGSRWAIGVPAGADSLDALVGGLLVTYLVPFEVASVLLLVALVGAIVLAKEERA